MQRAGDILSSMNDLWQDVDQMVMIQVHDKEGKMLFTNAEIEIVECPYKAESEYVPRKIIKVKYPTLDV